MRDAFFLALFPVMLFYLTQRPFIGLGMWIWAALFFPNGWMYGFASTLRYNLIFTALTVLSYFGNKKKAALILGPLGGLVLAFFFWTTLTSLFALAPSEIVWDFWGRLGKIVLLFLFTVLIVEKKLHFDFFIWCLMLSVGFYACVEGLKYIASGGGHRIDGMPGHVIGDRNDLALALAMLLPLSFYLLSEFGRRHIILRLGLLGTIVLMVLSIIGTNSRGGLVALISVGAYLFMKSQRKIWFVLLAGLAAALFFSVVPEQWFARMHTIGEASKDASFMGRVVAWKLSFILAVDHPLFGGGFKALEFRPVWASLSQEFGRYSWFYTGDTYPDSSGSHAAHSIYFQVLGDHGFIGLFLLLAMLSSAFFLAGRTARQLRAVRGPDWAVHLATMLRLSIFTFAVGGAALSLAYFDFTFALFALIIALRGRILQPLLDAARSAPRRGIR